MDSIDARGHDAGDKQVATGQQRLPNAAPQVIRSDTEPDFYKMNHAKRGNAVIINNRNFQSITKMSERKGTDIDAVSMYGLLDTLGFEQIDKKDNLTVKRMTEVLTAASNLNHTDSDCFICVILSHGEEGSIYGIDGKITIEELVRPFKGDQCKTLAGKPKIFFIQACRGSQCDPGVTVSDAAGHESEILMDSEAVDVRRIPTEADCLFAYSVAPGFYSWRNQEEGSWFIQAVVDVFTKNWKTMDLMTMMTRVNKRVALDFQSRCRQEDKNKKKQVPCITSMLTKDVFFNK